ncbi:hypothetical protein [Mycobacterium sp. HUMS_1102779]|uniref:hypothetical protein n=1 Tax=Mycobacterium sp. HUMS_1102779 TaxID=3383487 RepID=UPI003899A9EE
MSDTFDTGAAGLAATPLTQAVVAAATFASTTGPVLSDPAVRAVIDAIHSLETRVIALNG